MTRLLSGLILSVFLIGCFSGCASLNKSDANNAKTAEYQALEKNVKSLHEFSVFKESDPRLFTPTTVDVFQEEFAREICSEKTPRRDCIAQFYQAAFTKLSEMYFAADTSAVGKTCAEEPLICDDLVSMETLFRRLHNASVEESRNEKLGFIEDWKDGKLTDEELKSVLHLDFKFENGALVLSQG